MINGEVISLRPVQASDASLLLQWENDQSNWSVSSTTTKYTLGEIIALIDSLADIETSKQARFIIINRKNNLAFGAVDLFSISFEEEKASVGILIADPDNRNKGFAAKSIEILEEICVEELGIYNLEAKVHQNNASSRRLFEKIGFSKKKLTQDGQLNNADYIETLIFEKCLKK
ncbi:GNAT family N-acetyltransferase [Crocinitomicaceae bacterium]|nr:GNAT family N-acetyltransferase [Crocinitomicaceae bacterium]